MTPAEKQAVEEAIFFARGKGLDVVDYLERYGLLSTQRRRDLQVAITLDMVADMIETVPPSRMALPMTAAQMQSNIVKLIRQRAELARAAVEDAF